MSRGASESYWFISGIWSVDTPGTGSVSIVHWVLEENDEEIIQKRGSNWINEVQPQ